MKLMPEKPTKTDTNIAFVKQLNVEDQSIKDTVTDYLLALCGVQSVGTAICC